MDTGNFPEKEFRKIPVKMIQDLRNTMEKMLSKVLEELKNRDEQHSRRGSITD